VLPSLACVGLSFGVDAGVLEDVDDVPSILLEGVFIPPVLPLLGRLGSITSAGVDDAMGCCVADVLGVAGAVVWLLDCAYETLMKPTTDTLVSAATTNFLTCIENS
jgi:hypothetical protein